MSLPTNPPLTSFQQLIAGGVNRLTADVASANPSTITPAVAVLAQSIATQGTKGAANFISNYIDGTPISQADTLQSLDDAIAGLAAASLALTAARSLIAANAGQIRLVPNYVGVPPRSQRFFS
jgi:hypothetical protein